MSPRENLATDDPHSYTVLRAVSPKEALLTKVFTKDRKWISYGGQKGDRPGPYLHSARTVDILSLDALEAELRALDKEPRCCFVAGAIVDGCDRENMRRIKYEHKRIDKKAGETIIDKPTLRDVPRFLIPLDVDSLPCPDGIDPKDLIAAATYIRSQLPSAFHNAACVAQATSGHCIKDGLRLRIFFLSDRPLTCAEIKTWLTHEKAPVDFSIHGANAVVYTASPIFEDSCHDPLPGGRIVRLAGDESVTAPSADELAAMKPERQPRSNEKVVCPPEWREIEESLNAIPNDGDGQIYDNWLFIGMALQWAQHHRISQSVEHDNTGFELWDQWSQSSHKYDPATLEAKWDSFDAERGGENGPITVDYIFRLTKEIQKKNRRKPTIQISTDLNADLAACVDALVASPTVEIFQRGGSLVMRGTITHKAHDGREIKSEGILQHSPESLRPALAEAAIFAKWDGRKRRMVECYPPNDLAIALVKGRVDARFPVLRGVVNAPTLRADGSILDQPGYDIASGLFYDPKGVDFGTIAPCPTKEDAESALRELEALICKFPFVDDASHSVALARFLTGVIRFSLKCSLMFEYIAPAPRTGKSKLNDIGTMITDGHEAPVISASSSPEEREKQLTAMARSGARTITLDNLPNGEVLKSELLCQMLSQAIVEVRAFHTNDKLIQLPNVATVVVNGNNIGIGSDLTERAVRCSIDAKMELPGLRKFEFDPVKLVDADRPKYLRACLTILRAHAVAGYPVPNDLSSLGGFDDWNRKIRGALLWLGRADPCETMNDIRDADPQRGSLLTIMDEWEAAFGNRLVTAAEVIVKAEELAEDQLQYHPYGKPTITKRGNPTFLNALEEVATKDKGHISAKSLGHWLMSQINVVMNGKRFATKPKTKSKKANKIALIGVDDDVENSEDFQKESADDTDVVNEKGASVRNREEESV